MVRKICVLKLDFLEKTETLLAIYWRKVFNPSFQKK